MVEVKDIHNSSQVAFYKYNYEEGIFEENSRTPSIAYSANCTIINAVVRDLNNDTAMDLIITYMENGEVVNDIYLNNTSTGGLELNTFKIKGSGIIIADIDRDSM